MKHGILTFLVVASAISPAAIAQAQECQSAYLRLSGNLPSTAPIDPAGRAEPVVLSFSLSEIGAPDEILYLRAARVREDQWRLNFARNEAGDLDDTRGAFNLLLEFDGAGQQQNSVGMLLQSHSSDPRIAGSAMTVNFDQFTQLDRSSSLTPELLGREVSECGYDGQIVAIKTRPDSVRDELNPIVIEER